MKETTPLAQLIESMSRSFGTKPSGNWLYRDADGSEVMRVLRFDPPGQAKQYRPVFFDGAGWRVGDPPDRLLPLYRLPDITEGHVVWVCEGEKCTDAAASVGLRATTSAHGSSSAEKTDWSALAGRTVVILPDNDTPGAIYTRDVVRLLIQQSPHTVVKVVALPDLPPKGDLVDWLERRDSIEPQDLKRQLEALARLQRRWTLPR